MLGLAMESSKISGRLAAEKQLGAADAEGNAKTQKGRNKRRVRRKKSKKKDLLIPDIKTAKCPCRGERHVAQDLYLAMRCAWSDAGIKLLSRVVLANWQGVCVMDSLVNNSNFLHVRKKIITLVRGKVLVGHDLDQCLYALQIQHPWANLRDGASYLPFMKEKVDPLTVMVVPRALEDLACEILQRTISSIEDSPDVLREQAKACMDLYRAVRVDWENEITKLMQQKERQRSQNQMQAHLDSIKEDQNAFMCEQKGLAAEKRTPPLFTRDVGHTSADDHSTLAPTETSHDDESSYDSIAPKRLVSDASIWMPKQVVDPENSEPASVLGFWSRRPEKESTHPIDANDWLNEEEEGGSPQKTNHFSDPAIERGEMKPSHSQAFWSPRPKKESTHPIDVDDWLNEDAVSTANTHTPEFFVGLQPRDQRVSQQAYDSTYPTLVGDWPEVDSADTSMGQALEAHYKQEDIEKHSSLQAWGLLSSRAKTESAHPSDIKDWPNDEAGHPLLKRFVERRRVDEGVAVSSKGWDVWSPRPQKESAHPIDADEWLNEDGRSSTLESQVYTAEDDPEQSIGRDSLGLWTQPPHDESGDWLSADTVSYSSRARREADELEMKEERDLLGHLPSHLLDGSSSEESDHEKTTREETNHHIEGMDWLVSKEEPGKGKVGRGFRHRRQSSFNQPKQDRDGREQQEPISNLPFFLKRTQSGEPM